MKKNILFLCARVPIPLNTGAKIRTFHLLKALSSKYNVTMLTMVGSEPESEVLNELRFFCKEIVTVINLNIDKSNLLLLIKNFCVPEPFTIRKYYSLEFQEQLEHLLTVNDYHCIHCDHIHLAQHLLGINFDVPWLLDEHNIESVIWKRLANSQKNPIKKLFIYFQFRKMEQYELGICEKANIVITVSEEDKTYLLKHSRQDKIFVIENGVDMSIFRTRLSHNSREKSLVFVGSMDWWPNDSGIQYFLENLWLQISSREDAITLYVVGRNPTAKLKKLVAKYKQVVLTGTVDDVTPYIDKAAVYIVPLYVGGGTRIKILEAFAMKKCVISTSLGAEGIDFTHNKNILIANDDASFVKYVNYCLENNEEAKDIGNNACQLVKSKYEWEMIGKRFVQDCFDLS